MDRRYGGWGDLGRSDFADAELIRALLAGGADPDFVFPCDGPVLHRAVEHGTPVVVAEIAARVLDVEAGFDGRTALWQAVFTDRPDNARVLITAGANAWRPIMSGWSPGRLSLAGPTPSLFAPVPGGIGLSADEADAVVEAWRLRAALPGPDYAGISLACVAGIDVAAAARRLGAIELDDFDRDGADPDGDRVVVGATDVPGGCMITQPWGDGASTPGVMRALSAGTYCYGLYANPKSADQGGIARGGVQEIREPSPFTSAAPADEVLRTYLYQGDAGAYACAYTGLRPVDGRAVTGPPDVWLLLPVRDWWA